MKVLLSIKPEYVEKIFNGEKKYEYRKAIFTKRDIESIVIYATKPIGRIVGEFKIAQILQGCPATIWGQTSEHAGVKQSFYDEYFKNRKQAFAIQISDLIPYEEPFDPKEIDEQFVAPQSFKYYL